MKPVFSIMALLITAFMAMPALAVVETYVFDTDAQRHQYKYLAETLRCPKCQNQNIADSNAPIATDLRREVHRLVKEGQSNDQIVDFMVDRFGDFVVYKPRLDGRTVILWFGPLVIGLSGLFFVVYLASKNRRKSSADPVANTKLSDAERERINKLLND